MQRLILLLNKLWFAGGILSLFPVTIVHADELICPAAVHFSQMPLPSVKGWDVSSRTDRMLNDGGFVTSGPPKELADLKGEDYVLDGKKGVLWDELGPEDNRLGIWFSCSYGQWAILLSKKVQGTVSTCWSPKTLPAKLICK
jgi:hypothetical protein